MQLQFLAPVEVFFKQLNAWAELLLLILLLYIQFCARGLSRPLFVFKERTFDHCGRSRLGRHRHVHEHRHVHIHIHIHVHIHVLVVVPCRASLLVGWVGGWVMSSFRIVFLSFCRPVVNFAVTPPSRVAVVLLVSCSRLVVAVSSCGGLCLKSVPVSYDKYIATGKSGAFNDRARPVKKMGKIRRLFGEPLGHVITFCGQLLVSSTGGDFFFFFFRFFFLRVCVVWRRRLEEGACTFKTSPCVPAPRANVEQHVDVVPVHTGTF